MAMNCREYREAHPAATPEAREHLATCADCRIFAETWDLLRAYPPIAEGPGFLSALRRKLAPRILRFAAPFAAAAAVLLVAVVLQVHRPAGPAVPEVTTEERELVENLELLQNFDLLRTLELVGEASSPVVEVRK
jgi:hypothetical protein